MSLRIIFYALSNMAALSSLSSIQLMQRRCLWELYPSSTKKKFELLKWKYLTHSGNLYWNPMNVLENMLFDAARQSKIRSERGRVIQRFYYTTTVTAICELSNAVIQTRSMNVMHQKLHKVTLNLLVSYDSYRFPTTLFRSLSSNMEII